MFYVYVIQSKSDAKRFYIGSTKDLKLRLTQHNQGFNKSTNNSKWQLVYYEAYLDLSSARKREQKLKHDGRSRRFLMQRIEKSLSD